MLIRYIIVLILFIFTVNTHRNKCQFLVKLKLFCKRKFVSINNFNYHIRYMYNYLKIHILIHFFIKNLFIIFYFFFIFFYTYFYTFTTYVWFVKEKTEIKFSAWQNKTLTIKPSMERNSYKHINFNCRIIRLSCKKKSLTK